MEDDETLDQEEGEGGEVEVDVEGDDDGAGAGEVSKNVSDEGTDEVDLETNLSHIIRIETTGNIELRFQLFSILSESLPGLRHEEDNDADSDDDDGDNDDDKE